MKAYKVELLIIDHDAIGAEEVKSVIENVKYPNRCISPTVMHIEDRDIGEWDDSLPINQSSQTAAEYERLFGKASND